MPVLRRTRRYRSRKGRSYRRKRPFIRFPVSRAADPVCFRRVKYSTTAANITVGPTATVGEVYRANSAYDPWPGTGGAAPYMWSSITGHYHYHVVCRSKLTVIWHNFFDPEDATRDNIPITCFIRRQQHGTTTMAGRDPEQIKHFLPGVKWKRYQPLECQNTNPCHIRFMSAKMDFTKVYLGLDVMLQSPSWWATNHSLKISEEDLPSQEWYWEIAFATECPTGTSTVITKAISARVVIEYDIALHTPTAMELPTETYEPFVRDSAPSSWWSTDQWGAQHVPDAVAQTPTVQQDTIHTIPEYT